MMNACSTKQLFDYPLCDVNAGRADVMQLVCCAEPSNCRLYRLQHFLEFAGMQKAFCMTFAEVFRMLAAHTQGAAPSTQDTDYICRKQRIQESRTFKCLVALHYTA